MIEPTNLRVDVFRAGFGNPHVRITHIPTGTVKTCDEYPTQRLNYAKAIHDLAARLHEWKAPQ